MAAYTSKDWLLGYPGLVAGTTDGHAPGGSAANREETPSVDRHSHRSECPRVVSQGGASPPRWLSDAHQRGFAESTPARTSRWACAGSELACGVVQCSDSSP